MNKSLLKLALISLVAIGAIGAVGAQAYYSHELAQRVAAREAASPPAAMSTVEPRDPWSAMHAEMQRMQAQMDQVFQTAFGTAPGTGRAADPVAGPGMAAQMTQVDVEEQGDHYVVKAQMPGAKESDIDVQLNGRLLNISSQTQASEDQKADDGHVIAHEDYANSFQQAFTLPGPVNATGMQTQFKDGVLTVTIPKATS